MTAEPVIDTQPDPTAPPPTVRASLSPSRAADFKTCPLLYRFRSIDRLPERPTVEQVRGTLVHAVLERLFDLPAAARTPESAGDLVAPQWDRLVTEEPELAGLFAEGDAAGVGEFLRSAAALLEGYFAVEDPRRLEPAERESLISAVVDDELLIRGYLDRLDVAPDGALRVVDYKTGKSPRPGYETSAVFQMRFYGLVLWRERGVLPKMLQLVYLGDGQVLRGEPTTEHLEHTEQKIRAIWSGIEESARTGEWKPRRSKLCGWCAHQAMCPEFGGTPPEIPEGAVALRLGITG